MLKFPKQIYVKREEDTDGSSYLLADETPDTIEDGEKVAIYELREVQTKRVTHTLIKSKGKN